MVRLVVRVAVVKFFVGGIRVEDGRGVEGGGVCGMRLLRTG